MGDYVIVLENHMGLALGILNDADDLGHAKAILASCRSQQRAGKLSDCEDDRVRLYKRMEE